VYSTQYHFLKSGTIDWLLKVSVKGCPFQLYNVKIHNLLLLDFLRKQTEGVFIVEIAIRGRHCLTWNANTNKILESSQPVELDITEENIAKLHLTTQSVKRVLRILMKQQ